MEDEPFYNSEPSLVIYQGDAHRTICGWYEVRTPRCHRERASSRSLMPVFSRSPWVPERCRQAAT
jgi:hypothetical protein